MGAARLGELSGRFAALTIWNTDLTEAIDAGPASINERMSMGIGPSVLTSGAPDRNR